MNHRFESRWTTVEVLGDSPAIMLDGMAGANLGIWCAHGEGRCHFPDAAIRDIVLEDGLAPLRYRGCLSQPEFTDVPRQALISFGYRLEGLRKKLPQEGIHPLVVADIILILSYVGFYMASSNLRGQTI